MKKISKSNKLIKRIELSKNEALDMFKADPYKIDLRSQRTGEKLIEDFMIAANETIATHIYNMSLPFIYRVHGTPKTEKITDFINLLKVVIREDLNGSICIFPKSKFTLSGKLHAYGKIEDPKISGDFNIRNISIPELMTTVRDVALDMGTNNVTLAIRDVVANGSDFNVNILTNWDLLKLSKIAQVRVNSRLIDLDKLMQVSNAAMAILPKPPVQDVAEAPADIPVEVLDGGINLRNITTGDIVVQNTTGKISLFKNVFYLDNLKTNPIGGDVIGNVSMNLVTTDMSAVLSGKNFDMEKVLLDAMQMKDMLSGDMNFIADVSLSGLTMTEQMESLKGYVDFNIKDGQLGPFGKLENFLMAENIRENPFFSSTIGSIITSIFALALTTLAAGAIPAAILVGVVAFFLVTNIIFAISAILCFLCIRR